MTPDVEEDWTGRQDIFTDWADETPENIPTVAISNDGTDDTRYHFYMCWQNPDADGAVTFDGIEAKMYYTLTPPTDDPWPATGSIQPTLEFKF